MDPENVWAKLPFIRALLFQREIVLRIALPSTFVCSEYR